MAVHKTRHPQSYGHKQIVSSINAREERNDSFPRQPPGEGTVLSSNGQTLVRPARYFWPGNRRRRTVVQNNKFVSSVPQLWEADTVASSFGVPVYAVAFLLGELLRTGQGLSLSTVV